MKKRNDDIERICANCENAALVRESDLCICKINGAVKQDDSCKKFKIDLLKLSPIPRALPDEDSEYVAEYESI